jgi:predicted DNA-binding transcriptional regulator AlpA
LKHDQLHSELSRHHLITRKQLRELLPVSNMTIRRWEQDGLIPAHFTIGRTSFWRLAEVLETIGRKASLKRSHACDKRGKRAAHRNEVQAADSREQAKAD